ncbi:LacI family transcriptional regulator [Rhodococcoides trifolii]|uniref:LacI family transcriptional regulator n=1 Tax=Rhodococcoides trifolii TaxID=908250 RepID=A0A917FW19_9NOCA|nr:LacI family DNA-binding transcriptional regulator [Rhodococcus trifolii]GGG13426.1 LacI family transcriptional regulator [Rhodococcus trifolii]
MTDTRRTPTIRSVAAHAGVSKSLVSLVLRGSPNVSADKRAAVERAIADLGYRPNLSARSLTQQRTHIVGILVNDLRNPWFIDCLDGMNTVFDSNDLKMFLGDGRLDRSSDESLLHSFLEMRLDGLVLVGTREPSSIITEAAAAIPTVVVASRDLELPHVDVVANDDRAGTGLAVEHLLALGHRQITHIAGSFGAVAAIRAGAYREVMESHGLGSRVAVELCDMTEEGGYRAAVRALAAPTKPTALYAVNDIAAVGAMTACQELGVAVPQDVSVVGYDNTSVAQLRHVWLTSVDNASADLGVRAARALLARIDEPGSPAALELVDPRLHIRGSTSAPIRDT